MAVAAAIAVTACGRSRAEPDVARIPRYHGKLPEREANAIAKLRYAPVDRPLAWTGTGELIVGHTESYSSGDVGAWTCEGSGFYAIDRTKVRAIATGAPACDARFASIDPAVTFALYVVRGPNPLVSLRRLDLRTLRTDSLTLSCDRGGDPAIAPDGRTFASVPACGTEGGLSQHQIFVSAPGDREVRLTLDGTVSGTPSWSPDGTAIAVSAKPRWGGDDRVTLVALNGHTRRDLGVGDDPSWSPDGRSIAFLRDVQGARGEGAIFVVHTDGSGLTRVFLDGRRTTYHGGFGPIREGLVLPRIVWSPDSRWIAFTRAFGAGASVWKLDLRTGELRQVTAPGD